MAKKVVQTLQQKRAAEQAARLEIMKQELAVIREQERLFKEKLAARTPEEIQKEQERWEADRQIQIETARRRSQPVEPRPYRYVHEDDEE